MEWIKVPCPRCNSSQEFKPKYKPLGNRRSLAYVKCTVCRYEQELDTISDVELSRRRRQQRRMLL